MAGRALSRIAAVTFINNQITEPTCAAEEELGGSEALRRPIISVTKVPSPLALPGPGSVTYTYKISNPGRYTMNTITLFDDKCSDVDYVSGDANSDSLMQAAEVWIYKCTTWLTQDTNNEARAVGYANGLPATDIAYATVNVGTQLPPPLIHIIKTPSRFVLPFRGGRVTYVYEVSNPGVVALYNVDVVDDKCNDVDYVSGDSDDDELLDMDETWTYACKADLEFTTTNTVTATGHANNKTITDVALATVVVAPRPVVVPPTVGLRSSAPVIPTTPTSDVPLLPNTGVGPEATYSSWAMVAAGVLMACVLLVVTYQSKRFLSSDN